MTYNTSTLMTLCSPDSRSPRFAENQLAARLLNGEESPPQHFRTEKQLTARADRPVRDPAHAVAFTTAVAVGGAGSVHRRTGMRAARALPGDSGRPGSPPATDCRQNPPPASPVNQTRCFADHRRAGVVTQVPTSGERSAFARSGAHALRAPHPILRLLPTRDGQLPSGIWQGTLCPKRGGAK